MERNSGERFDGDFDPFDLDLSDDAEVITHLVGDLHCPLCGCHYDAAETQMIREHAQRLTLAVQCHCCGTGSLVTIEREPQQSAITELTPVERAFFAYLSPINDADVRRIHTVLKSYQGDLRGLI
jgi:hypothetical protein